MTVAVPDDGAIKTGLELGSNGHTAPNGQQQAL
jgi:hypothetical protein